MQRQNRHAGPDHGLSDIRLDPCAVKMKRIGRINILFNKRFSICFFLLFSLQNQKKKKIQKRCRFCPIKMLNDAVANNQHQSTAKISKIVTFFDYFYLKIKKNL